MIESVKPIFTSFQHPQKFAEQHRLTSQMLKWFFRAPYLILPLYDGSGRK